MKKKICFFISYFPLGQGGAEYQAYLIAKALDKSKYDVFFLTVRPNNDKSLILMDGYRIYTIRANSFLYKFGNPSFLYYFQIRKILFNEKPEIVYRRMGFAILGILGLLKKKMNFKLIWACSSTKSLDKMKNHGIINIFDYIDDLFRIYGIKRSDKILVQGKDQMQALFKNFKRKAYLSSNLHAAPQGEIKKSNAPIKVVWIANIKKLKQPEIFLKLAKEFEGQNEIRFIMIGRADPGRYQKVLMKRMDNLKQFEYKGELSNDEVNNILSEAHIFVNTSLFEGFPNTFIQAWMRKVPVISLNVDPDDILKKQGIGFHSGNYQQMASDLRYLIVNNRLREEMGVKAQNYALENYSLKNIKNVVKLITT
jgi:glycosyltransferase involved in cell wall biosynthesis